MQIPLRQEISPVITRLISNGLKKANQEKYDLVVLDMNTFGGLLADADSIRIMILNSPIPIWVYINKNAASAGALISIACDKIFMQSGSTIGAATVVNDKGEVAPDKYQSYMRGIMRATAEAKGKDSAGINYLRNPFIAEAMVDERISIANVTDSGRVITFTATEAMQYQYCDQIYENINQMLDKELKGTAKISVISLSWLDKFIGFLLHPAVRGILIAGIIFGLYFELQSPGLGFPSIAAVIAALLYFAPAYLEGLAANWEIFIFLIGVVLICVEIFAIPGFGIIGFSGITMVFLSLALAMIRNVNFDFSLNSSSHIFESVAIIFVVIISFIYVLITFHQKNGAKYLFKKAILADTQENIRMNELPMSELMRLSGIVITDCKPIGKVLINGQIHTANSNIGFLVKDTPIIVVGEDMGQLIVKKSI